MVHVSCSQGSNKEQFGDSALVVVLNVFNEEYEIHPVETASSPDSNNKILWHKRVKISTEEEEKASKRLNFFKLGSEG